MIGPVELGVWELALAATLLLVNAGISLAFRLGIARSLVINAARMVAQLLLIGLILTWLFEQTAIAWTLLLAIVMVAAAGHEAVARQTTRLRGIWAYGLGTTAMMAASFFVTAFALAVVIQPDPWHDPRYAIPLLGMLLGNCLNGVSLGLATLSERVVRERPAIEAQLALGRRWFVAVRPVTRAALRTALIPVVNSMAAAGIVALPGMMTGQILGGVPPMEAVKYQIVISFGIAAGTGFGVLAAIFGATWRLSDDRHRLRLDRLQQRDG